MIYLLDTCVVSDYLKGNQAVLKKASELYSHDVAISVITDFEIEFGFYKNPNSRQKYEVAKSTFCNEINVIPVTQEISVIAAKIRADLAIKGTPIGPYDLLIAATAKAHGLVLVTSNQAEFARIDGLQTEDWR